MAKPIIYLSDSYKYGHSEQYPKNMVGMYDYFSSRGGVYNKLLFTGAQGIIKKYLTKRVKVKDVKKVAKMARLHGVPFDYDGWMYIAKELNGLLPITIKALPEGTLTKPGIVLLTVESNDKKVPWVVGFVETLLMKIWYSTTVSSRAYHVKEVLEQYGSKEWVQFAYHCFGDRGTTNPEAAEVAGFAHMAAGFKGTDNFNSLFYVQKMYGVPKDVAAAFSVYATEHSSTTAHSRNGEEEFVYNQLLANPDTPIMSFVADSYDVYNFTDFCTNPESRIRKLIESRPHQKLVLRPDSGKPLEVLHRMTEIMFHENKVRHILNSEDKCVFTDFSILWGDGIDTNTIEKILIDTKYRGYAAENFIFGSGGDLVQNLTRDTQKFAIKCSSITVETEGKRKQVDVFKDPITDQGKASLKGRVSTYRNSRTGELYVINTTNGVPEGDTEALQIIFKNGKLLNETTLEKVLMCNDVVVNLKGNK